MRELVAYLLIFLLIAVPAALIALGARSRKRRRREASRHTIDLTGR